jgi:glucose-6-phosphate-specific signal transduction histidine kinase
LHDITDRKRAERKCKTLLEGNRFLIHKSLAVQEEERRHLARELHDELGQCMTAIQADAEIIHDLSRTANPKIETSAVAILDVSARIYDVVHSMMQRLRPSVLDDLGLVAAIEEETQAWQQRYRNVDLDLAIKGELSHLGEAVNISVYRIIQESLTNISKHAEASCIGIRLEKRLSGGHEHLWLRIEDNGLGMETDGPAGRGLGLIGMRERVEALNGSFSVASARGRGLRIEIAIPLTRDRAA